MKIRLILSIIIVFGMALTGCGDKEARFQEAMEQGQAALNSGTSLAKRQQAIEYFSQAIDLRPDSAQAHLKRGHAHVKNKDMASAFQDYNEAANLDPQLAQAYYHRALMRIGMLSKDKEAIVQDLKKALELDPTIAAAGNLLMLYEKSNQGGPPGPPLMDGFAG